jgi:hypothetical protein
MKSECQNQVIYLVMMSFLVTNDVVAKKKRVALANPDDKDEDGLLRDVEVQSLDKAPSHEEKRRDVDQFFHSAILMEHKGKMKKCRTCKLCQ